MSKLADVTVVEVIVNSLIFFFICPGCLADSPVLLAFSITLHQINTLETMISQKCENTNKHVFRHIVNVPYCCIGRDAVEQNNVTGTQ